MLFNSAQFLVFFALVLGLYHALGRRWRWQNALLLVASYVFYAAWDWRFLFLIFVSTLVDYAAGRAMDSASADGEAPRGGTRRRWLVLSLVTNLGILGAFKYLGFGIENLAELLRWAGFQPHLPTLSIVLPVGISFYTFQTIGYSVDVYRGKRGACRNLLDFALYVAYFPQLVAGPIEKSTQLLPQIQAPRTTRWEDWRKGVLLVLLGYFKKVVIADTLAPLVDEAFAHPDQVSGAVSLLAVFAFALQIYGDFAGYTLIARGCARMMGFDLMRNFRMPYLAEGPRDFWRRWHVSLSTWLRDYLYIPLGGNRRGRRRTLINLMLVMTLGGLWHGAAWNFVLWGVYHGIFLVLAHLFDERSWKPGSRWLRISFTFCMVLGGWLLFRVNNMGQLQQILQNICFNFSWQGAWIYLLPSASAFVLLHVYHLWQERHDTEWVLLHSPVWIRWSVYAFILVCVISIGFRPQPFIYFQF